MRAKMNTDVCFASSVSSYVQKKLSNIEFYLEYKSFISY